MAMVRVQVIRNKLAGVLILIVAESLVMGLFSHMSIVSDVTIFTTRDSSQDFI